MAGQLHELIEQATVFAYGKPVVVFEVWRAKQLCVIEFAAETVFQSLGEQMVVNLRVEHSVERLVDYQFLPAV